MNEQHGQGALGGSAKKWIVLVLLAVAVTALVLFAIMKLGLREVRIVRQGDQAPEFRLSTLDGKQASLADFRGRIVMVHFWATWCPPCVEELPALEKLYRSALGGDFALLAVSVDEGGAEAVTSFMKRNALSLPVLLDPGASVAHSYGTFKFPETYILDRSGIVRRKVIGQADWSDPANIKALRELIERP